jgi:glutamate-1-semialdehyde 2,1-aminomutase
MNPTDQTAYKPWWERHVARYKERTPVSARMFQRACESMPGGNTRSVTHFLPYPLFLAKGEGCFIHDVDGNRYLDFINNYTSLIHGHAHPAVVAAANAQSALGSAFPAPSENQYLLAELICSRVGSVDQIRYCNSGTEATMHAIRGARAVTGKPKVI